MLLVDLLLQHVAQRDDVRLPESFDAPQDLKNAPPPNRWGLVNDVRTNWSIEQAKGYLRRYMGYVSYLDDQMARVLDALRASGLQENTIIVFMSDNGHSEETDNRTRVDQHKSGLPKGHFYGASGGGSNRGAHDR